MKPITYLHPFKAGDLIALLPGIKHLYETTGSKAIIYQRLGMPLYLHMEPEAKNNWSAGQCMGLKTFEALKPLIEYQDYVHSFKVWEGEKVDIDVSLSRDSLIVNAPYGSIHHWPWALIPEMQCNLFVPWIDVDGLEDSFFNDKIVINRTSRYRNPYITYFFLKNYADQLIFVGLEEERDSFCSDFKLNIPWVAPFNFLELAKIIKSARLFMGNQSVLWHISDSMKSPRILEACADYPNTFPTGSNGYFFLHQKALETLFEKLAA